MQIFRIFEFKNTFDQYQNTAEIFLLAEFT